MPQAQARRAKAPPENSDPSHSGRLLLRMPPELHADLARTAEREGVSLNAYITRVLTGADGGRPADEPGSRLIRYAVIADLVLVAVAAVAAVALLLAAWI